MHELTPVTNNPKVVPSIFPEPSQLLRHFGIGMLSNNTKHDTEPTSARNLSADHDVNTNAYSAFSRRERRLLTVIIGFSMLFSPLSANIYFPAIDRLTIALSATTQEINLTITSYLVFQAISPVLFGDVADSIGRRPVFIVMFTIYTVANLALARQNSFTALLGLRMLQSLGCSTTVAISYGVVADVATAAERGSMLGFAMIATNLGPALAPVIGGVLTDHAGWRWIFWFLLICGACMLSMIVLCLPETARSIVGNGLILPRRWRQPLCSVLMGWKIPEAAVSRVQTRRSTRKVRLLNPLRSLRILFYRDSFIVVSMSGLFYLLYYCIQASITPIFKALYNLSDTNVGLCYLAIGGGVVAGGLANGKLMDYNYARVAKLNGLTVDKVKGDDLLKFPIEKARTHSMLFLNIACAAVLIGYGWLLEYSVHISVPLVFQFCLGFLTICLVQTFNTLLVDILQSNPSAAAASGNIVRCGLSAAGIAALDPVMHAMGYGWYFTFLGILGGLLGIAGSHLIASKGMIWRTERVVNEGNEAERKSSRPKDGVLAHDVTPSKSEA